MTAPIDRSVDPASDTFEHPGPVGARSGVRSALLRTPPRAYGRAEEEVRMDCPVCGCPVDPSEIAFVASCACCGAVWLVHVEDRTLDHVLVGAEG
jgi:hypothetical protein